MSLSPKPLSPTLTLINPDPISNSNPIFWDSGPPVADPGMGGPGGSPLPPPLTNIYGWMAGHGCAKQSASDTGVSFHLNPELLATIFVRKLTKNFQLQGGVVPLSTHHYRGLCPSTPLGAPSANGKPPFRLLPLANCGYTAADRYHLHAACQHACRLQVALLPSPSSQASTFMLNGSSPICENLWTAVARDA